MVGYIGDGAQDLVLDLSFRHYRGGAAPRNWHRNGELLHPGNLDKDLDEKAASKIAKYRELCRDHRRQLDFLPAIASTSGRIQSELLRTIHLSVYLPPRCFLQHSQEQDRSHGSEGCGAPDQHQHRRPPAPDQETAANFQQALRPPHPSCFCPPLSPPSELVQGVAMSTAAVTPFRSFVQTPIFSVSPSSFSLQRI